MSSQRFRKAAKGYADRQPAWKDRRKTLGQLGVPSWDKKSETITQTSEFTLKMKQWRPKEGWTLGVRGLLSNWRSYRRN